MPPLVAATLITGGLSLWALYGALRGPGVIRRLRRASSAAIWGSLAAVLGCTALFLQAFRAFSGETLVARVSTRQVAPDTFELTYTPVEAGQPARRFRLAGDQWSVTGGVVKWHRLLTVFGMNTYHRPLRVAGQFSDLARQRSHLPTVEALDPAIDRFWEALYWMDPKLPFVEAVYGSAAYVYVEPDVTHEIYVTNSGYMIKRNPR